jgi:hypothetical protein
MDSACVISNINWGTVYTEDITMSTVTPYATNSNTMVTYTLDAP